MYIDGNKIFLVGNRGHKNMGDEIILLGNMKLLLNQNKKLYIACSNKKWLKDFHSQFFPNLIKNDLGFKDKNGEQKIIYLSELPKGFRSFFRFLKDIKFLKYYFQTDAILIGGGEIFTEETPGSYWYWLASVWFLLFGKRKLYLSGGIQIPKKIWNKIAFNILFKKSEKIYIRDFDLLNSKFKDKLLFYPDTSIFVYDNIDLKKFKWNIPKTWKDKTIKEIIADKNGYLEEKIYEKVETPYIVVNLNKKAEQFLEKIKEKIDFYYRKDYEVYFVPVCKSPKDMDINYYHILKKDFPSLKLLDWENWDEFIKKLSKAEKVFTTRLHLFLISFYLDLDVSPFVYQKKVEKMKKVLYSYK